MKKTSIFLLAGLAACGSDKSSGSATPGNPSNPNVAVDPNTGIVDPNTVPVPGNTNVPTTEPSATGFDEVKAASYAIPAATTFTGEKILRSGRMVSAGGDSYKFNWAGTSFTCRPAATSVSIKITAPGVSDTSSQYLDVFVDGQLQSSPVKLTRDATSYKLALKDTSPHVVTWVLRTEANYGTGVLTFNGFDVEGGDLQQTATPIAPARQVEFVGDSITNGYGARSLAHSPVLYRDSGCTTDGLYTPYKQDSTTESASLAFSTLAAHSLNAQYALVASSGRGAYRNRTAPPSDVPGTATPTMSTLYPYALHPYDTDISGTTIKAGAINAWDSTAATAANWQPAVVVLNLGTNDFARHGTNAQDANLEASPVDPAAFTAAYSALLTKINQTYPSAKIIPMAGPMLSNTQKTSATAAITAAINQADPGKAFTTAILDVGVQAVDTNNDTGCEFHPLPTKHAEVAAKVADAIKAAAGWN